MYNRNAKILDKITLKTLIKETKERDLCTFATFRRYNAEHHYFPSGGKWTETFDIPHYNPDLCRYEYPRIPEELLEKCLYKSRVRTVLVSGDSTGRRNHVALVKAVGNKCQVLKDNSTEPDFHRGAITALASAFGFTKIDNKRKCQFGSGNHSCLLYFERMEHSHMPTARTSLRRLTPSDRYPDLYLVFLPFFI
ncbi:hypothetical protein LSH36_535g03029 [Paralvinella palmiformis]|uniref:Uncharacterized protein n=1 Tax=Paralvinella palmiformis TaxID=53620 RepID=A0AAD9J701_9ANNE|nr:hypothetical protein LSH36_535g03029 [Paralvinella palmiformis]